MTRRNLTRRDLVRSALSGIAPLQLLGAQRPGLADRKPNIVLILADDLGYGDLSCYGATKVRTPNIDGLATQGIRFTDAHSPSSICTPSRYGLLTGRYCWRTWLKRSALATSAPALIEEGQTTLATLLKSAGYHTECIGKWHLGFGREDGYAQDKIDEQGNLIPVGVVNAWESKKGGPDWNGELKPGPLEAGFDYYYGLPVVNSFPPYVFVENHRVVGLRKDNPIGKMESRNRGRMEGGTEARWKDEDLGVELAEKAVSSINHQREARPFFLYFAPPQPHFPFTPNARFKGTSQSGMRGDFIHELDWSVGRILSALDERGFIDNTLVIFTSDNGGQPGQPDGNGPVLRGAKGDLWEGGNRVPFLARWPRNIVAGSRSNEMICLTDMLATFATITGETLRPEDGPDSFDVLPALLARGSHKQLRGPLVMGCDNGMHAIREGPWKLILAQGGGGYTKPDPSEPSIQLYNLERDLAERDNIYRSHPDIVQRLRARLEEFKRAGRSRPL